MLHNLQNNEIIYRGFLQSSSLWKGDLRGLYQFELGSVANSFPQNFPDNLVFGKIMELCFQFQLENSESWLILQHNFQIIEEKITLGELDFIIQNKQSQQKFHIEMVFKFYLYEGKLNAHETLSNWIGPNRKDSLEEKLKKLKEKQLPLLSHPHTKNLLENLNIDVNQMKQRVLFKAQLYVPHSYNNFSFQKVNDSCIAGIWISAAEFLMEKSENFKYYLPEKKIWHIDPISLLIDTSFKDILPEIEQLHNKQKSPLVWKKDANSKVQRMFVVFW